MANRRFIQFFQTLHKSPVLLDCNFKVDSTAGVGQTGLKGAGIQQVYMHSSAPSAGNPNPGAGVILVQLQDNYQRSFGLFSSSVSALGSSVTTTTNHQAEVITALGTATLAQWQAKGLPVGITPAVGVSFIATATGTIGGAATVAPIATAGSGIDHIEIVGDSNLTLKSLAANIAGVSSGAYMILQCFAAGVAAAPADGSTINLGLYLSNSSILVQGE